MRQREREREISVERDDGKKVDIQREIAEGRVDEWREIAEEREDGERVDAEKEGDSNIEEA